MDPNFGCGLRSNELCFLTAIAQSSSRRVAAAPRLDWESFLSSQETKSFQGKKECRLTVVSSEIPLSSD